MELESLRGIVRYPERVIVVRPMYIFVEDTVSLGTFEHIYIYYTCPLKKFSKGGRVIGNN